MKKLTLSGLFLFLLLPVYSQVGIGTTNPQETLHVAGTLRVDNLNSSGSATKLGGLDDTGTFREIVLDDNLLLTNNILSVKSENKVDIATLSLSGSTNQQNVDLKLQPGAVNEEKGFIILTSGSNNSVNLKSIKSDNLEDGRKVVILFRPNKNIELKILSEGNGNGAPQNQFLTMDEGTITLKKNGMVELVYSTDLNRWVVLSYRK